MYCDISCQTLLRDRGRLLELYLWMVCHFFQQYILKGEGWGEQLSVFSEIRIGVGIKYYEFQGS